MVFNVRCFKCGENDVRLVLGGRAIIHARCHACDSNLLAEIMELEAECEARRQAKSSKLGASDTWTGTEDLDDDPATQSIAVTPELKEISESDEAIPAGN